MSIIDMLWSKINVRMQVKKYIINNVSFNHSGCFRRIDICFFRDFGHRTFSPWLLASREDHKWILYCMVMTLSLLQPGCRTSCWLRQCFSWKEENLTLWASILFWESAWRMKGFRRVRKAIWELVGGCLRCVALPSIGGK